jgi:diacylglycerol kinase (ATP)
MRAAALLGLGVSGSELQPFRAAGVEFETHDTLSESSRFEAALVFGGDGTIHRHLRPLIEHRIPLLSVPLGSGNDFAHALGINSVQDAIASWQEFCSGRQNVRAIDAGLIRHEPAEPAAYPLEAGNLKLATYFCNVAGVGLDCEANRRANAMPRWLRANGGYVLAAVSAILRFVPTVVTLTTPGEPGTRISEAATLLAVANTTSYGSGMRIAPRAQLADGLLDACFVRRTGRLRLLRSFPSLFRGEHLSMPEVQYLQAARLHIAAERPLEVYADGERVGMTPVEISVVPQAMRVIVPLP